VQGAAFLLVFLFSPRHGMLAARLSARRARRASPVAPAAPVAPASLLGADRTSS